MLLTLLIAVAVLAMFAMIFAMARVSARADRVAPEQRGQLEGEVRAADQRSAAG